MSITIYEVDRTIHCQRCAHTFQWSNAALIPIGEEEDNGIFPQGPACPRCKSAISMTQLKFPEGAARRISKEAARMNRQGFRPAVVGVWGGRGGIMRPLTFPASLQDRFIGKLFDETLVKNGWCDKYGSTWIRTAFWNEAVELGSTDKEARIMVHFDGRFLHRSPVVDWITVKPEGFDDDE